MSIISHFKNMDYEAEKKEIQAWGKVDLQLCVHETELTKLL